MRREVAAVVFFLKRLVEKREKVDRQKIELFVERLTVFLQEKYRGHWYPDKPSKGQAFRCIRVNRFQRQDPELLRACQESGLQYEDLGLPRELTLWVDPGEVCCRFGEQNHAFSVASFSSNNEDAKDVTEKVTSAVERVTSDYHSGSSSDEEGVFRETCSTPTVPHSWRANQAMNPAATPWNPKTTSVKGNCRGPLWPHYGFRPPGAPTHILKRNYWTPPSYRGGPRYKY